jgi:hypothetical protein
MIKVSKMDDVKQPGNVIPSATARPIIVSNAPAIQVDPMMAPVDTEPAEPASAPTMTHRTNTIMPVTYTPEGTTPPRVDSGPSEDLESAQAIRAIMDKSSSDADEVSSATSAISSDSQEMVPDHNTEDVSGNNASVVSIVDTKQHRSYTEMLVLAALGIVLGCLCFIVLLLLI